MQRQSYLLATLLHGLILILAIFGLPQLTSPPLEVKPVIEVEVLTISTHPNAAPNQPIPSPVKEPKPEPAPQPSPVPSPEPKLPPPEPPPPPEPKLPPPPKPLPTPPKPPEPPEPKSEPVKPPEPKSEPVKPPEPKPEPVKPPPKPPEPKKVETKKEDFFDMMSKTLPLPKESSRTTLKAETKSAEKPTDFFDMMAKTLPTKPQSLPSPLSPPRPQAPASAARSLGPSDADRPLSRSEEDGIRKTISPCWNFDPGMANVRDIQIEVRLFLGPDGSVKNVELVDRSIVNRSPQYQAAALAAMRAPMNPACNKLPIPPGAYKSLVIVFAPKDFM